jgi:single-strand DNA-binding protein
MARGLNKVMLIGNLGKDPEMRVTASGTNIASFSLATTDTWKDHEGNPQERTEWHNIVMFQRLAEIASQYLKKGSKAYIEGRIQTRSYDDKNTGQKKYITEILATSMLLLDSRQRSENGGGFSQSPPSEESFGGGGKASPDSDLPF